MKQQLSEALALWDSAPDWNDSNTTPKEWQVAYSLFAAAARLVERLLPGECENCQGDPHKIDRWTCPVCHGSGRVWDEEIVEAVAKALWGADDMDAPYATWEAIDEGTRTVYRIQARVVLSAIVQLAEAGSQ